MTTFYIVFYELYLSTCIENSSFRHNSYLVSNDGKMWQIRQLLSTLWEGRNTAQMFNCCIGFWIIVEHKASDEITWTKKEAFLIVLKLQRKGGKLEICDLLYFIRINPVSVGDLGSGKNRFIILAMISNFFQQVPFKHMLSIFWRVRSKKFVLVAFEPKCKR